MTIVNAILWRRLDLPGHEAARLDRQAPNWRLSGTAVFVQDVQPCRLDYVVVCDPRWQTLSVSVAGWLGQEAIALELLADGERRWWLNGNERPEVAGCLDIDLSFSPSTNLLPIRRLGLAVGESAEVTAAWLRFPELTLEPFRQIYRRMAAETYRFASADGEFVRDLTVNAAGLVTEYPGLWQMEAVT